MHFPAIRPRSLPKLFSCFAVLCALMTTASCGVNLVQYYFGDLFGKASSQSEKNADLLAVEGMQMMQQKKYDKAVKAFQQLKEQYPYSKYAPLAELKLGDAHFYNKDYSQAAIAYDEFVRLHPRNEVVPYVLYQIGMCHFLSFSSVDRDPEETRLAVESFQRVVQNYPQSEYSKRAQKQIFECQKRIIAHEYNVGKFYYIQGKYSSAKKRLETASKSYPQAVADLGYQKAIDKMLADCEKHIARGDERPSIWTRWGF